MARGPDSVADVHTRAAKTGAQTAAAAGVIVFLIGRWVELSAEDVAILAPGIAAGLAWVHNYLLWRGWIPRPGAQER